MDHIQTVKYMSSNWTAITLTACTALLFVSQQASGMEKQWFSNLAKWCSMLISINLLVVPWHLFGPGSGHFTWITQVAKRYQNEDEQEGDRWMMSEPVPPRKDLRMKTSSCLASSCICSLSSDSSVLLSFRWVLSLHQLVRRWLTFRCDVDVTWLDNLFWHSALSPTMPPPGLRFTLPQLGLCATTPPTQPLTSFTLKAEALPISWLSVLYFIYVLH